MAGGSRGAPMAGQTWSGADWTVDGSQWMPGPGSWLTLGWCVTWSGADWTFDGCQWMPGPGGWLGSRLARGRMGLTGQSAPDHVWPAMGTSLDPPAFLNFLNFLIFLNFLNIKHWFSQGFPCFSDISTHLAPQKSSTAQAKYNIFKFLDGAKTWKCCISLELYYFFGCQVNRNVRKLRNPEENQCFLFKNLKRLKSLKS